MSLFGTKLATVLRRLLSSLDALLLARGVVVGHVAALTLTLSIVTLVCVQAIPGSLVSAVADVATFAHLLGVVGPLLVGTLVVLELIRDRAHTLVLYLTVRLRGLVNRVQAFFHGHLVSVFFICLLFVGNVSLIHRVGVISLTALKR